MNVKRENDIYNYYYNLITQCSVRLRKLDPPGLFFVFPFASTLINTLTLVTELKIDQTRPNYFFYK